MAAYPDPDESVAGVADLPISTGDDEIDAGALRRLEHKYPNVAFVRDGALTPADAVDDEIDYDAAIASATAHITNLREIRADAQIAGPVIPPPTKLYWTGIDGDGDFMTHVVIGYQQWGVKDPFYRVVTTRGLPGGMVSQVWDPTMTNELAVIKQLCVDFINNGYDDDGSVRRLADQLRYAGTA